MPALGKQKLSKAELGAIARAKMKKFHLQKAHPYMTALWYPEAIKDEMKHSGTWLASTPWRGVLHTTEGSKYEGARAAYLKKNVAPHFTISYENKKIEVWQHIPLDRAARALVHKLGRAETNRTRCIQIEIVWGAARTQVMPNEYLDGIAKLMRWIEARTEIKPQAPAFYGEGAGWILAQEKAKQRFSDEVWLQFNGWCGHQHVPQNTHWDPGNINIQYLLTTDFGVKPMYDPALKIEVAAACGDPEHGGAWLVQPDGAVFAFGGAVYYGGMNGHKDFTGRRVARIDPGRNFPDDPWRKYKYVFTATSGERYGRGGPLDPEFPG